MTKWNKEHLAGNAKLMHTQKGHFSKKHVWTNVGQ